MSNDFAVHREVSKLRRQQLMDDIWLTSPGLGDLLEQQGLSPDSQEWVKIEVSLVSLLRALQARYTDDASLKEAKQLRAKYDIFVNRELCYGLGTQAVPTISLATLDVIINHPCCGTIIRLIRGRGSEPTRETVQTLQFFVHRALGNLLSAHR